MLCIARSLGWQLPSCPSRRCVFQARGRVHVRPHLDSCITVVSAPVSLDIRHAFHPRLPIVSSTRPVVCSTTCCRMCTSTPTTTVAPKVEIHRDLACHWWQKQQQVRQTQCGVNCFILDSRRVLAPAPKVPGSDIKTHLKSRFCLQAILKKGGAIVILD